MDTRTKILSREGLRELLDEHRRAGRKIVLANGIFDLLHVGHVRYLKAARAEGDILIVGLNSDASTRRLKGEGRPILTERARAMLIAALAVVDYVTIFDDLTPQAVIARMAPQVLVNASDFQMGDYKGNMNTWQEFGRFSRDCGGCLQVLRKARTSAKNASVRPPRRSR